MKLTGLRLFSKFELKPWNILQVDFFRLELLNLDRIATILGSIIDFDLRTQIFQNEELTFKMDNLKGRTASYPIELLFINLKMRVFALETTYYFYYLKRKSLKVNSEGSIKHPHMSSIIAYQYLTYWN